MIDIKNYSHGADIYTASKENNIDENEIIDFSSNINPFGLPNGVKQAIIDSLNYAHRYPDVNCRELTKAIALHENIACDNIYCSNGAIESIFRLVNFLKPQHALVIAPTFSEYEQALKTVNCKIEYYYLKEEDNFIIHDDIINYIKYKTDIVFICNPNNPTGQITNNKTMKKILEHCKITNTIVMIDECFMDFVKNSNLYTFKNKFCDYDNLIILKAFTKLYAMAGIRLGYCISSNKELIEGIKITGAVWNVSTIAQTAGVFALKEKEYVHNSLKYIDEQKVYLVKELQYLGFKVFEPYANYIFLKSDFNIDLKAQLIKYNILIRSCNNYIGLNDNFYRIAVKKKHENEKLIKSIKEILKK